MSEAAENANLNFSKELQNALKAKVQIGCNQTIILFKSEALQDSKG